MSARKASVWPVLLVGILWFYTVVVLIGEIALHSRPNSPGIWAPIAMVVLSALVTRAVVKAHKAGTL